MWDDSKCELTNVIVKFISQSLMTDLTILMPFKLNVEMTYSSQFIHLLFRKDKISGSAFFCFYSIEVNSVDFRTRLPGYEFQLRHSEAVRGLANYLIVVCPSFLIAKMGMGMILI